MGKQVAHPTGLGNRLTLNNRDGCDVAYTHNMTNEYTNIGGSSPSYDFAGNMTADAAGYVYYYDYENRLTKITDAEPCDVAVYSYDALGRRIEKITYDPCGVADATTRYYYDGWRVLTETDGCDVRQREYAYGNYIDEVLIMTDNRSGETEDDHYYLHDHLFSPVALLGEDATVLERYEYDAYGKVYFLASNFSLLGTQTSGHGNPVTFTGQRLDELDEGNLLIMYYKNRYYLIDIGRFAQRDPLGTHDEICLVDFGTTGTPRFRQPFKAYGQYRNGVNVYVYVGSNPVKRNDPHGLQVLNEDDYLNIVVLGPRQECWRWLEFWVHYVVGSGKPVNLASAAVGLGPALQGALSARLLPFYIVMLLG